MTQECVFVHRSKKNISERSRTRKIFDENDITLLQGYLLIASKYTDRMKRSDNERYFQLRFSSRAPFSRKGRIRRTFRDFILRNRDEVIRYVYDNQLRKLIYDVRLRIREFFPTEDLILEVVDDEDDNTSELVVYVSTSLSPQEAYTLLKHFDEKYWLKMSKTKDPKSLISINLEFK